MNRINSPLPTLGNASTVPRGLDTGAPGHTPIPQTHLHAPGQTENMVPNGESVVLTVTAPANKTVHVTGAGREYTMSTAFEGHHEVITITDNSEPPLARLELHGVRANTLSLRGAPPCKMKDWLVSTATNVHTFPVEGQHAGKYTWTSTWHDVHAQLELFGPDSEEAIAVVRTANVLPAAEDPAYTSFAPQLGTGLATPGTESYGSVATRHAPPLRPANATITLTPRAVPMQDWVVVSYLLLNRQSRPDAVQGQTLAGQLGPSM